MHQSIGFGSIYASLLSREAFALDLESKVDRLPTMVKGCHSFRLLLLQDFIKIWDKIVFQLEWPSFSKGKQRLFEERNQTSPFF